MNEAIPLFEMYEEPNISLDIFDNPTRRDMKTIAQNLKGLDTGNSLTVLVEHSRYGLAVIQGDVQVSDAQEVPKLLLAGRVIGKQFKKSWAADTELRSVITDEVSFSGSQVDTDNIEHGDLVTARFSSNPYGEFTITGVATKGEDNETVVLYGWILSEPADRVLGVETVLATGSHSLPVPPRRPVMEDE